MNTADIAESIVILIRCVVCAGPETQIREWLLATGGHRVSEDI
jgi:hypothetical protein